MAKKQTEQISAVPEISGPRPRVKKMTIRNFRSICDDVVIELDDIVVLVGPNNVGKSSILRAYELIMSEGSNEAKLSLDDFPGRKIDVQKLPQIELETIIYDKSPGDEWIREEEGEKHILEKWIWDAPDSTPTRMGFNVQENNWSDKRPWGAANVANARRPKPYRLSAFNTPEQTAKLIVDLLMATVKDKIKHLQKGTAAESKERNTYKSLISDIRRLQSELIDSSKEQIEKVETNLSNLVSEIFPDHSIKLDAAMEDDLDKSLALFKENPSLRMGPSDGFLSKIENQGSGAQRALMWSTLRVLSEDMDTTTRPRVLLLDEPEICLHPSLVREACKTLYELPKTGHWQVMVTTHSPVFVDFSRDNTTIIKVDKAGTIVQGTTVFKPSRINLSEDEKEHLKLLNLCDPYVAEFFFGGKVILVEGDTEYSAFKYAISKNPDDYKDVHIIRARGKDILAALGKILNQFGASYSILHDADSPTAIRKGKVIVNPAWTTNSNIKAVIDSRGEKATVRLLASLPTFEKAYLETDPSKEKPFLAVLELRNDSAKLETINKLLKSLLDHSATPPAGCMDWTVAQLSDLESNLPAPN